jgi:hypothetical protein
MTIAPASPDMAGAGQASERNGLRVASRALTANLPCTRKRIVRASDCHVATNIALNPICRATTDSACVGALSVVVVHSVAINLSTGNGPVRTS